MSKLPNFLFFFLTEAYPVKCTNVGAEPDGLHFVDTHAASAQTKGQNILFPSFTC